MIRTAIVIFARWLEYQLWGDTPPAQRPACAARITHYRTRPRKQPCRQRRAA